MVTLQFVPNMVADKNGRLFCVSTCGKTLMRLRDILEDKGISNLETRAEKINNKFKINLPPDNKHDSLFPETNAENDLIRFRNHLSKGEPVVIKDVLDQTHGISWEPMVMSRALCEHVNQEVRLAISELQVIDCSNGLPVNILTHATEVSPVDDIMTRLRSKRDACVEPWTFGQCLGEAVFILAGCPHQVRNLRSCTKLAVDFVSPENIKECMRLKQEIRELPCGHCAKEDKLEITKMVLHAMNKALTDIEALMSTHDYKNQCESKK
ncbi:hypothetical protein L2E82_38613 [Cichorium intybus]|uniref:Uncharacterized protein n=1 Tax=Cichorium intybus TaxID=13427 RepID=A0ACB9AH57_CICIN|nr:hypothetical protein L2E82_38613 [Cichorium intybus]